MATIDTAIAAHVPGASSRRIGQSRLNAGDGMAYGVLTRGDDAPRMLVGPLPTAQNPTPSTVPLERTNLGGNIWCLDDSYTSGGTGYKAIMVLSYDKVLTISSNIHSWGVWLRQSTASDGTVTWDDITT